MIPRPCNKFQIIVVSQKWVRLSHPTSTSIVYPTERVLIKTWFCFINLSPVKRPNIINNTWRLAKKGKKNLGMMMMTTTTTTTMIMINILNKQTKTHEIQIKQALPRKKKHTKITNTSYIHLKKATQHTVSFLENSDPARFFSQSSHNCLRTWAKTRQRTKADMMRPRSS